MKYIKVITFFKFIYILSITFEEIDKKINKKDETKKWEINKKVMIKWLKKYLKIIKRLKNEIIKKLKKEIRN